MKQAKFYMVLFYMWFYIDIVFNDWNYLIESMKEKEQFKIYV